MVVESCDLRTIAPRYRPIPSTNTNPIRARNQRSSRRLDGRFSEDFKRRFLAMSPGIHHRAKSVMISLPSSKHRELDSTAPCNQMSVNNVSRNWQRQVPAEHSISRSDVNVQSRTYSVSVWHPAGIKLQRLTHASTRHGSATRTRNRQPLRHLRESPAIPGHFHRCYWKQIGPLHRTSEHESHQRAGCRFRPHR